MLCIVFMIKKYYIYIYDRETVDGTSRRRLRTGALEVAGYPYEERGTVGPQNHVPGIWLCGFYGVGTALPPIRPVVYGPSSPDLAPACENTGFLNTCGLALIGGLDDLGGSSGLPLVCAAGSDCAGLLYFFNVHWFCLANRSAAVPMSGLSGSAGCATGQQDWTGPTPPAGKSMTKSGAPPDPFGGNGGGGGCCCESTVPGATDPAPDNPPPPLGASFSCGDGNRRLTTVGTDL